MNQLLIKRGARGTLPALAQGEPAVAVDTGEVFVGKVGGNIKIASIVQADNEAAAKAATAGTTNVIAWW